MRLTCILRRQHLNNMFIKQWNVQSKRKVMDLNVSEFLESKGVKVNSSVDYIQQKEPIEFLLPELKCKKNKEDDPNWHDRLCHSYNDQIRLIEGINQISVLTKTIVNDKLPEKFMKLVDYASNVIDDNKEITKNNIERVIMQANHWDATQSKLPVVLADHPALYKYPYGITNSRKNVILWEGLLRFTNLLFGKLGISLHNFLTLNECLANMHFEKDGDLISSKVKAKYAINSNFNFDSILSADEIRNTEKEDLPDIFPLKSTIDLNQENIYQLSSSNSISNSNFHPHLHTLISTIEEAGYSQTQIDGNGIFNCFTFAMAKAKQLYGDDVKGILPKPVVVQGIQSHLNKFTFMIYQLNTTDLDGIDGIKNVAWIDSPNELYTENELKLVENYNSEIIKKLFAFQNHGIQ